MKRNGVAQVLRTYRDKNIGQSRKLQRCIGIRLDLARMGGVGKRYLDASQMQWLRAKGIRQAQTQVPAAQREMHILTEHSACKCITLQPV
jgi:hypothetical protein